MWPWKSKKLRSYLVEGKYKLQLAFEHGGHKYYQFENAFDITAGRGLNALTYYDEFRMRCDKEYLEKHVKAIEILMNDPKKIKIGEIALIHQNLKERINLVPFPDHIYKLASVMFFDENESPYDYDMVYNQKKISAWRSDPDMLPFLVKAPLKGLMPYLDMPDESLKTYFMVAEAVDKTHQAKILDTLSNLQ